MLDINARKSVLVWIAAAAMILPLPALSQNLDDEDAIEEWVPPAGDPASGPSVSVAEGETDQESEDSGSSYAIVSEEDGEEAPPPEAPARAEPIPDVGAPVSPDQDVDLNFFVEKLSPYGEWLWTDQYGWVWRPNGTGANWRPYTYGRWLYTDAGWYWHSYWPWGWAPFHYGNWAYIGMLGWAWVPGTVWGPAWVMWRYADGYLGWSPIPPGYAWGFGWGYFPVFYDGWVFVDWGFFWDPYPYHHYRHRRHCQDDFRHSHYPRKCRDSAHPNCHKGFTDRFVARHAKAEVPKYKLADTGPRYVGKLSVQDGRVQVYRPRLKSTGAGAVLSGARPVAQPRQPAFGSRPRVQDFGIIPNAREKERPQPMPQVGQDEPMGQSPMSFPQAGESIRPRQPALRQPNMPRHSVDLERLGPTTHPAPMGTVETRDRPERKQPAIERFSPGSSRVTPVVPRHTPTVAPPSPSRTMTPSVSPRSFSPPSGSKSSGSSSSSSSGKSSGSRGSSGRSHRR
jgi:uncharacterized membrane protein YgcG